MDATCLCLHELYDHAPDDDGHTPCAYWYPEGDSPCQCPDFTPQAPRPRVLYRKG